MSLPQYSHVGLSDNVEVLVLPFGRLEVIDLLIATIGYSHVEI
ncbi:MAG TPA: hypothetical protein VKM55_19700 [Candidatus Lokiarchaeia archaeon]|nr:hypothetical protein [Candidatus Lokiarchaeia archaeon]